MIKKLDSTLIYKYNLLATDEYAYKHIVEIILNTIKELQLLDNNPQAPISKSIIPNLFTRDPNQEPNNVLKLLFQNPYFQDEEKLQLLKTIKDNLELLKSKFDIPNNKFAFENVFDFTNSVFFTNKKIKGKIYEKLFPFFKPDKEYSFMSLDKDNKTDQLLVQLIDQLNKLFLFKEHSKEKETPEIDEAIIKNISSINKMIKYNSKYVNNFSSNFFEFLSKSWFKDFDEVKKESIKKDILEILPNLFNRDDKKKILSYLYTHIKIDKMENVNFTLDPSYFLDSINTIENEKYRKKVYKNLELSLSPLLNEMSLFQKEFHNKEPKIGRMLNYYKKDILSSEYDLFDILNKNQPEQFQDSNLNEFKELDFIFKRKDFDLNHFKNQFENIKKDYLDAEKYNNVTSSELNKKALKLSKFISFSYQNIYLMDYLYKNDNKLFQDIVNTYLSIFDIKLEKSVMFSEKHFVYTDFNVNHFLDMNQEFKETYLKNLKDIMQNVETTSMTGYDNLLKLFQKEPKLLEIFQDAEVNPNIKNEGYKIYFNDIKEYSKILSTYFIDSSIDNDEKFKVLEKLKNSIEIDTNYNFPNLQF